MFNKDLRDIGQEVAFAFFTASKPYEENPRKELAHILGTPKRASDEVARISDEGKQHV